MNATQPAKGGLHTPLQQLLLLEERVRQAGVTLPDAEQDQAFHGLRCVIGGHHCIIKLAAVAEVSDNRRVTPVPGAAGWVEGVFNFRGALVPVFRLQQFFAAVTTPAPVTGAGPLIVLRRDRKGHEFNALRVDSLHGMQKFRDAALVRRTTGGDGLAAYAEFEIAVDGASWLLLDIARLMQHVNATPPSRNHEPTADNSRRSS